MKRYFSVKTSTRGIKSWLRKHYNVSTQCARDCNNSEANHGEINNKLQAYHGLSLDRNFEHKDLSHSRSHTDTHTWTWKGQKLWTLRTLLGARMIPWGFFNTLLPTHRLRCKYRHETIPDPGALHQTQNTKSKNHESRNYNQKGSFLLQRRVKVLWTVSFSLPQWQCLIHECTHNTHMVGLVISHP